MVSRISTHKNIYFKTKLPSHVFNIYNFYKMLQFGYYFGKDNVTEFFKNCPQKKMNFVKKKDDWKEQIYQKNYSICRKIKLSQTIVKINLNKNLKCLKFFLSIGPYHPLDGVTNPKYKLLHFWKTNFLRKEEGTSF